MIRWAIHESVPAPIRDAVIVVLAAGCAFARALPLVQFPTVIHEGKGPVFFHYPVLGFALAALVGWRRPFCTLLLFGIVHLGAVLAFEWHQGVYDAVLSGPITPHVYLVVGNLYIIAALITLSIGAFLLITGRSVTLPAVPDSVVLIALFGFSFLARWWWGHHVLASTGGNYLLASDDGQTYHTLARGIVAGVSPTAYQRSHWGGMLYWYFLAAIYRVTGVDNFPAVIAIQAVLGALVPVAIYLIARTLTGSRAIAAATGLLCALNKVLIFLAGVLGMEALYLPLFYVGLTWLISQPRSRSAYVGIGLVFGLANMARNEIFGYLFVLLLATLLWRRRDRFAIRGLALACLGFLGAWAAQGCLTYLAYHRFMFFTDEAAVGFAMDKFGISENALLDQMGFNPFADFSRAFTVGIHYPTTVTKLLATGFVKRLGTYLFMPGDGLFDPLAITTSDFIHNYFPSIRVSYPALIDSYALLFCVIGFIAMCRYRALALYTFVIYIAAGNALLVAKSPRHRAVLIPLFALWVVQGVAWFLERVRRESDSKDVDRLDSRMTVSASADG
jgi:hypothetical protein